VAEAGPVCAVHLSEVRRGQPCQFPHLPLFEFEGKHWCAFHLPTGNGSPKDKWTPEELQAHLHGQLARAVGVAAEKKTSLDLSDAVFPENLLLDGTQGPGRPVSIKFERTVFSKALFFRSFRLGAGTMFQDVHFEGRADFRGVLFERSAAFFEVTFGDIAQFMGVKIPGEALFYNTKFMKEADFSGAEIADDLRLDGAHFVEKADFSAPLESKGSILLAGVFARDTRFDGEVTFRNRTFGGEVDFSSATFGVAPEFHGCKLHQATRFGGPKAFPDTRSSAAAARYRTLAHAMGDMRAHDEEAMFFTLQHRALRRSRPIYDPIRVFSAWYDALSSYGQSLARPLALLATANAAAFLAYAGLAFHRGAGPLHSAQLGALFAFQQLFRPLGIWIKLEEPTWPFGALGGRGDAIVLLLGTLQPIVTAAALYLLALGIRWRFRRW